MDDTSSADTKVQEAEIVSSVQENDPIEDEPNSQVSTLLELENSIKMKISALDRLKEEIKPVKEMLESTLEANLEYAEISENAKEAAKKKTAKKKELLSTESGKKLTDKLKELTSAMKEHTESLSYFLQEYSKLSGANEIEGEDGELRQIVYVAKLVRKTKLERD